ncbi:MAG: DUF6626 family protein [Alphaproteobacteria bacterium]
MMPVFVEAFDSLKLVGCVSSQREFSTEWLGKQPSYFSSMVARRATRRPSTEVFLTFYSRVRNYIEDADGMGLAQRQMLERLADRIWTAVMDRVHREVT